MVSRSGEVNREKHAPRVGEEEPHDEPQDARGVLELPVLQVAPEARVQGDPHRVARHDEPVPGQEEPGRRVHDHEAHDRQEQQRGCDAVLEVPGHHAPAVLGVSIDLADDHQALAVRVGAVDLREPAVAQAGHGARDPPDPPLEDLVPPLLAGHAGLRRGNLLLLLREREVGDDRGEREAGEDRAQHGHAVPARVGEGPDEEHEHPQPQPCQPDLREGSGACPCCV